MKTSITGLLQGRITRRSLLAAALPAAGVSLAWAGGKSGDQGAYKLGGSWIASEQSVGMVISEVLIPLDPAGKTAALFASASAYEKGLPDLIAMFGADTLSDLAGNMIMTGRDTAKGTSVSYFVASGKPPVIKAIMVLSHFFRFTDSETIVSEYSASVYPPSPDGLPHGEPLVGPVSGGPVMNKRVPAL